MISGDLAITKMSRFEVIIYGSQANYNGCYRFFIAKRTLIFALRSGFQEVVPRDDLVAAVFGALARSGRQVDEIIQFDTVAAAIDSEYLLTCGKKPPRKGVLLETEGPASRSVPPIQRAAQEADWGRFLAESRKEEVKRKFAEILQAREEEEERLDYGCLNEMERQSFVAC